MERRRPRLPRSAWTVLPWLAVVGVAVTVGVPRLAAGATGPPVAMLLGVGLILVAVSAAGLYIGVTRDLRLPVKVALYTIGFHALIILVKFTLAPYGVYRLNREVAFETPFPLGEVGGPLLTGLLIFLLYLLVYGLIYRLFRRRLATLVSAERPVRARRKVVLLSLGGALLLAVGMGWSVIALPLLLASNALEYLEFVFTSAVSLVVALALAGATSLAALAFGSVTDRARAVGDAALLVSFFWLGLSFIALYHFLWVVYALALGTIWPLRVVVPK
jgi:hypothetical protein